MGFLYPWFPWTNIVNLIVAGSVERASSAVRSGGRRDGTTGAVSGPPVRADARLLGPPALRTAHLPAAGGGPRAIRASALPAAILLSLASGPGALLVSEDLSR